MSAREWFVAGLYWLVALSFVLTMPACSSLLAVRVGRCAAPQNPAFAGWRATTCTVDASDTDVMCKFEGRSGGKSCMLWAQTVGCGAWRVEYLECDGQEVSDAI